MILDTVYIFSFLLQQGKRLSLLHDWGSAGTEALQFWPQADVNLKKSSIYFMYRHV